MKNSSYIRILSIYLMVLIPLIYLYTYFDKNAEKERKTNEELVKEQFLTEMDKFQEDLKPEKHIEKAFKELEKKFGFPELENPQCKYNVNDEDNNFLNQDFVIHANHFLKENYGFEPFIFITSGKDLTFTKIEDKKQIFPNKGSKDKFLYTCIGCILFNSLNERISNHDFDVSNVKSKKLFIENINKIKKYSHSDIKTAFYLEMSKNISIFYRDLGKTCSPFAFFSNKYGYKTIYQFYNSFITERKDKYNLLGLYYALIRSSEIPVNKIISVACNNQFNRNIKRSITNDVVKIPTWNFTEREITYKVPFPFHFYNLIIQQKTENKELFKIYNDYFHNHSLELIYDKSFIKNHYEYYKTIIKFIICFLIIILILNIVILHFDLISLKNIFIKKSKIYCVYLCFDSNDRTLVLI